MRKLPFVIVHEPKRKIDRYAERLARLTSQPTRTPEEKAIQLAEAYGMTPARVKATFGKTSNAAKGW